MYKLIIAWHLSFVLTIIVPFEMFYEIYNNCIIFVLDMTALFMYFQFLFVLLLNFQLSIQTIIFF